MSGFELVPMDGGDAIQLPPGETVLGRGPFLRVSDKRVSRQHGLLDNRDGRLRLKPTHSNPCFLQASPDEPPRPLPRDAWCPLRRGHIFSLLPGQLMFRVAAAAAADGPLGPSATCEHAGQMAPALLPGPREKRRLPLWMMARVGTSPATSPGRQATKESRRGEETTKVKRRRNEGARADEWTQTTTITERVDVACRQATCWAEVRAKCHPGRAICHIPSSGSRTSRHPSATSQRAASRRALDRPAQKASKKTRPLPNRELRVRMEKTATGRTLSTCGSAAIPETPTTKSRRRTSDPNVPTAPTATGTILFTVNNTSTQREQLAAGRRQRRPTPIPIGTPMTV
ncbi:aprataxin and PNK-like factor isoform X2 [Syngnathus typhle]|uniref:aprataxin and PNK-like factor isoform X2 n=1 Tax=Syngnathus typhle TaxID=161592 RepID=UPI002A69D1EA|nr:aprataxin and PNK-like factor isoform X2 [Syngnathus typhle]